MIRMCRNADAPGSGPKRCRAAQAGGTGHARTTADDQHVTKVAFVRATGSFWQPFDQKLIVNALKCRLNPVVTLRRYAEIIEPDFTTVIRTLTQKKARFEPNEGRRHVCDNGRTQYGA